MGDTRLVVRAYLAPDDQIKILRTVKYWTIVFPGEFGQHIQETWSEEQIMSAYMPYWCRRMNEVGKGDMISRERCLEDWITVHWAAETDEFGNKL